MVDHGLDLAAAVATPRWSMDLGAEAIVEAEVSNATIEGLRGLGQPVKRAKPGAPFFGSAEVIEIRADGVLAGAVDHRRDAYAAGA